jgi:DNA polymerase elongation subunit (family B)
MKILTLDLETSPSVAHVWGLFDQTVSLSQLQESTQVLCFAAKWLDSPKIEFASVFHDGKQKMLELAHKLLCEADAVISYNGVGFDIPHLRREFLLAGLPPPSPFADIDLLKTTKSRFRFVSNKLEYVSRKLGLPGKTQHSGHELWVKCLAGDKKAWALMRKYNENDVVLTEQVYKKLLPWIQNHPHHALHKDTDCCQRCGSGNLQRRGTYRSTTAAYQRYVCNDCGSWSRGLKLPMKHKTTLRGIG